MLDREFKPPLRLREFAARAIVVALAHELARLSVIAMETRDRADRRGWALAKLTMGQLRAVKGDIESTLTDMGPTPLQDRRDLEALLVRRGFNLLRSRANADLIKAARKGASK